MQSSFDVLEWESTSKEQDSLVHRLFGDISTSDWSTAAHEVDAFSSKREKKESSNNEKAAGKPKKKRKDKREKNKFKIYPKLSSEQPETKISEASDDLGATAETDSSNFEESVLVHKTSEKSNWNESKKTKKRKRKDQIKQEDTSDRKEKNQIKTDQKLNSQHTENRDNQSEMVCDDVINPVKGTNERASVDSVNQSKETLDSATPLNVHVESIEGPNGCKSKKAKKKERREKRKVDGSRGDSEFPNTGECTPETNDQHKRRKKTSENEQDSSHEELKLKDTNSNILNPFAPRSKSSLHEKMTKQLESSRFRWINEQLYSTTGDEAVTMFAEDPNLFEIYHRGFTNQVKLWPVNPVDKIIEWLKKRPTSHVVADFGCGEAVIAQSVANKVHSFDLVAKNKFVTACNMAKVPLSSASVDIAVFCLSLMGTNLVDFLREANRVLKPGGILKVAEVTSRINDTAEFTKSLSKLGFKLQNEDTTNKMFVLFDFIKNKDSVKSVQSSKLEGLNLKPCIYKKR